MTLKRWLALGSFFCSVLAVPPAVEIVVVHCKEDLTWVADYGYGAITTVLDKCGSSDGPGHHVAQRNVGREGGSYLQFIVDRYDTLADWTVFTQGEKPTYGYKGHRLGGGHMMNNVRFQDYVEAAANRKTNPVFFVFSTVLVASSENVYQCLRTGYGGEYKGKSASGDDRMCGTLGDWQQWFAFPEWFKDMVVRLQGEQGAPIPDFNPTAVLDLFEVRPDGVMFFTQGARFAASREAIQVRSKAYYEGLLKHFNNVDPWAGYYLEWLWWYVLGGTAAPCGFEKPVLHNHQAWKSINVKQRALDVLQATVSGVSGQPVEAPPGTTVLVPPVTQDLKSTGGTLQVTSTNTTVQGDLSASSGGNLTVTQTNSVMTVTGQVIFNGAVFQIMSTATLTSTAAMVFTSTTITSNSGSGTVTMGSTGSSVTMTGNTIKISIVFSGFTILVLIVDTWTTGSVCTWTITTTTKSNRANSAISNPTYICGEALSTLAVPANGGVIVQSQCTATGNGAYSNTIGTLSYTSPATMRFDQVGSSSSKPLLVTSSWSSPSGMTLQVSNASTGAYCTPLVVYNNPGTCTTSFSSTSVDTCPAGYTCTISGSTINSTRCQVTYCQTVSSSSNNDGLLGLIALVALLPILALAGLAAWFFMKPSAPATPEPIEQYPEVMYPSVMYTDGMYPSAYEMGYEPTLMPTMMPTPTGATFGPPMTPGF